MSLAIVWLLAAAAAAIVVARARGEPARWALAAAFVACPALGWVLPEPLAAPLGAPRVGARGRYIGSNACAACHEAEHASWHGTYHRTMTQLARGEAILAPPGKHELMVDGELVEIDHAGDRLFVTMVDPELRAAVTDATQPAERATIDAPAERREVVMTTGSHHYQVYWVPGRRSGELRAAPVVWHREAARFVPRHDVFLQPPDARDHLVRWNSNCLVCHATAAQPAHDLASDAFETEAVELGVACEACHGPGRAHAEHYANPIERRCARSDEATAHEIVNPARIDRARSNEVCGQCHAYAFPRDEDEWWSHGYARTFEAGGELQASRVLLGYAGGRTTGFELDLVAQHASREADPAGGSNVLTNSIFWGDGTIRVGGREYNGLVASACFQRGHGDERIACVDCHDMHGAAPDDQLSDAGATGASCVRCHAGYDAESHTRHAPGSSGASCYGCHMPRVSYALYRALRSHRVDSPSVRVAVETGRPPACNLCHVDRTLAWTQRELVAFGRDERDVAVPDDDLALAMGLALRGDAAQRAIVADHLAAPEAIAAAGAGFQVPVLAELLDDPYSAVRFVAARGLVDLGAMRPDEFDFLGPAMERRAVRDRLLESSVATGGGDRPEVLLRGGGPDLDRLGRELGRRDDRPILIAE